MRKTTGFTLIEILVVVIIIGLIAAFAIPSYTSYVVRANRTQAQIGLYDLATRMENYYNENNYSYAGATVTGIGGQTTTNDNNYRFDITNLSASTYTLEAIPQNAQANDSECGSYMLDQLGQKTVSGSASAQTCWQ
jgi:type IV pilus assembly protein PilE